MSARRKRLLTGTVLIISLIFGLWLLRSTITYDMQRMFFWQQVMFWYGDLWAVLMTIIWMIRPASNSDSGPSQSRTAGFNFLTNNRILKVLFVVSLMVDIAVTSLSMHSENQGLNRAVEVEADILSISRSSFGEAAHYRYDIAFTDPSKNRIQTHIQLTLIPGERLEDWQREPTTHIQDFEPGQKMVVVHDPLLSKRVWFKDQPFGSTTGIAVLFAVIHILQCIVVFSLVASSWSEVATNPFADGYYYQLAPVAAEAAMLVLFGFALHQG